MESKVLKKLFFIIAVIAWVLPAQAADKPELVIYTYDSFSSEWGPGPVIKTEFEKTCDCTVTFVGLDSSVGVLGRVMIEGASSRADIALGLDTSLTAEAAATGLFEDHGIDTTGRLAIPADFQPWPDAQFIPFDWGYFAFVYDKNRVSSPPRSFEELLESDLKIVIQDPRTSTPGLGLMLWVNAVYGQEAPAIWEKLSPRIVTVTKGWWDSYSMFLEGEADMVLSYSTSPAYHLIAEGKDNYAAAAFDEGHYTQVEVAGILKSSDNKALARAFLDQLLGKEMQSALPTTNWMYPAGNAGVVPDGFETLITPDRTFIFQPEEVRARKPQWIEAWLNGLSQ